MGRGSDQTGTVDAGHYSYMYTYIHFLTALEQELSCIRRMHAGCSRFSISVSVERHDRVPTSCSQETAHEQNVFGAEMEWEGERGGAEQTDSPVEAKPHM